MKSEKSDSEKRTALEIAGRFIRLLELIPGTLKSHSENLGYASPSTIYAVKKGSTLPDLIKLNKLAGENTLRGRPNIDWLITGQGAMMIRERDENALEKEVKERIMGQPKDKLEAILTLLSESQEQHSSGK